MTPPAPAVEALLRIADNTERLAAAAEQTAEVLQRRNDELAVRLAVRIRDALRQESQYERKARTWEAAVAKAEEQGRDPHLIRERAIGARSAQRVWRDRRHVLRQRLAVLVDRDWSAVLPAAARKLHQEETG